MTLYSFPTGLDSNTDGAIPNAGLVLSTGTLFGTTSDGGTSGQGTVFAVSTDGTTFKSLYSFTSLGYAGSTNSDGGQPAAGLVLSGQTLYGTATFGGSAGNGTVFAVNTDGTGFTNLHSLANFHSLTGSDVDMPVAPLVLSGDMLYGTTRYGGSWGNGAVYKLKVDGSGFVTLHSFAPFPGTSFVNSDGANPHAGLVLFGNTLYGATFDGGPYGVGTVFSVNTDGTSFKTLYSFTGGTNSDGAIPGARLILSDNTLYGTTAKGGSAAAGTVFSISLPVVPPRLIITPVGENVVLSWPTNATGFTLQSTTNLISPVGWAAVPSAPVVVNGLNTVTNLITSRQQFFRLSQ